jgi:hypothetical protein
LGLNIYEIVFAKKKKKKNSANEIKKVVKNQKSKEKVFVLCCYEGSLQLLYDRARKKIYFPNAQREKRRRKQFIFKPFSLISVEIYISFFSSSKRD